MYFKSIKENFIIASGLVLLLNTSDTEGTKSLSVIILGFHFNI